MCVHICVIIYGYPYMNTFVWKISVYKLRTSTPHVLSTRLPKDKSQMYRQPVLADPQKWVHNSKRIHKKIYGYTYMDAGIWTHIYGYQYMDTHIWTIMSLADWKIWSQMITDRVHAGIWAPIGVHIPNIWKHLYGRVRNPYINKMFIYEAHICVTIYDDTHMDLCMVHIWCWHMDTYMNHPNIHIPPSLAMNY